MKIMGLSKKERHLRDLRRYSLFNEALIKYLLDNSNLPGKRGNIELAFSFGDYIEEIYERKESICYQYCVDIISEYGENRAPKGNEEFLAFCAIVAVGRIGKHDVDKRNGILQILKENAKDGRWRIREAVAMAIQDIMVVAPKETLEELKKWVNEDDYLVDRAIVPGLAEPKLMKDPYIAKTSFEIHKEVIRMVDGEKEKGEIDYKVLVKGLCYTLSVIITGNKDDGFSYLEELINSKNPILRKIARENLKKNRLKKLNGSKVSELQVKQC